MDSFVKPAGILSCANSVASAALYIKLAALENDIVNLKKKNEELELRVEELESQFETDSEYEEEEAATVKDSSVKKKVKPSSDEDLGEEVEDEIARALAQLG